MKKTQFAKSGLLGLLVAMVALATATSASANELRDRTVENHYLSSRIGEGELSLGEKSGVTFDEATEELLVADTGHNRLLKYSPSGESRGTLASVTDPTFVAVEETSGDIYVVTESDATITKLDSTGAPVTAWGTGGHLGGFGEITGIAVDATGHLFVATKSFELHELSGSGGTLNQCELPFKFANSNGNTVERSLNPRGIAVDTTGYVYVPVLTPYYGDLEPVTMRVNSNCEATEPTRDGSEGTSEGIFPTTDSPSNLAVDRGHQNNLFFVRGSSPSEGAGIRHVNSRGKTLGAHGYSFGGILEGLEVAGQATVESKGEVLYVADLKEDNIAVFTVETFEPPQVEILPPANVSGTTATLSARINPGAPAGNPPAWRTQYVFRCKDMSTGESGCASPTTEGFIEAGSEPRLVKVEATNLQPASEYRVYVEAYTYAGSAARSPKVTAPEPEEEKEEPALPPAEIGLPFDTGAVAPTIEEEAIAGATETSGTVGAVINPRGAETGYWVEYVTQTQYAMSGFVAAQRSPEAVLPVSIRGQAVSVTLPGLSPLTPYVMRFVAHNTIEGQLETVIGEAVNFATAGPTTFPIAGSCPNEALRGFAGLLLPDCRAYEQASPIDKNGGSLEAVPGSVVAPGESGNSITFYSEAGLPGGVGAQDYPTFIANRLGETWSTQGLLPPQALGENAEYLGLTPDGKSAITEATLASEGTGVFIRNLESGQVTTVVPYNPGCGAGAHCYSYVGASADGSIVYIETKLNLTHDPPTSIGSNNLYAWNRTTGQISLVDVRVNGEAMPEGGFAGPYNWAVNEPGQGGTLEHFYAAALNAISPDGSQIVYTERGEEEGRAQLYVRLGVGGTSPHSVKVSAYESGRSGPELPAAFLEATPDGRFIFFMSKAELTANSYAGEGSPSLYRYEVATGKLLDLTTKKFQAGPGVVGMLGASESGRVAYFVSTTVLTSTPGPGGRTAEAGQANLYRWQEGSSPAITFVASLQNGTVDGNGIGTSDSRDWSPSLTIPNNDATLTSKTARVSADGGVVVFASRNPLTGLSNRAKGCDSTGSGRPAPCSEFFRYAVAGGTLNCVSCSPTGAQPLNAASMSTGYINAADQPLQFAAPTLTRNLSANGDRFFFQTPDSLTTADKNGPNCAATAEEKETCLDVYEWEAPGTGTCTTATEGGGCLSLISSGTREEPSYFADADREGKNVFIFTASQLVPTDKDQLYDVYDAREFGGLTSQNPTTSVPCGSRAACQGPQANPAAPSTAATPNFAGPENPRPVVCKKGFVQKQGKCVKQKKKKKKHKKSKKKKHRKSGKKNHKKAGKKSHKKGGGKK